MVSQFSSTFLFFIIFGLVLIIETLLGPTVEALETVTIKAYCTGDVSYPFPVYDTVKIRLKDCETLGYVKKEVKCEKERITYAFIFEREQNHSAVVHNQVTTDGRNIQCVDYEDEEDSVMEHRLSTFYKAENKWAKMYETMRRDENELEKTEMTAQRMRDQIFKHPLFIKTRDARIALYSYIRYKESQKTLEIKAYCTGHRSNPVPVYDDVQRRLDACKQLGNIYWGVESEIGSFRFYYTFKYERKTGQNRTECKDHEDKTDKELEEHLSFYYYNGRDELLASLLRSYHNAKKELEEHKQSYMNNMGNKKYLDYLKKLEESEITNAQGIDQVIIQLQKQLKEDKSLLEEARSLIPKKNNEWETYYNKKQKELAIKKSLENEKLDTEMEMEEKLKNDSEKQAEKGGEEIIDLIEPTNVVQKLRQRKGENVIVSAPSQQ